MSTTNTPPFEIIRAQDPKSAAEIPTSLLLYGPSGTGKTYFTGTAGDRTLIVDVGSSRRTILSGGFRKNVGANPFIVTVQESLGSAGIPDKAQAYDKVCEVIDYFLEHRSGDIDTIVVDDATFLKRAALFKGLEFNQSTNKSQSLSKMKANDVISVAIQDYGAEMSLMEQFIAGYNEIIKERHGKNFILVAHERNVFEKQKDSQGRDVVGGIPILRKCYPGFTGSTFPDTVPAYFDWVFHTEPIAANNKTLWRVRTQTDGITVAKCRDAGVFSAHESDPNFLKLLARAKEAMK